MTLFDTNSDTLSTLNDILSYRAQYTGSKIAFRIIADNDEITELTYHQLHESALLISTHLLSCAEPGDRALLCYTKTAEFIKALFGCFYAGIIAVPAHPPNHINKVERMSTILNDSSPHLLLTTSTSSDTIKPRLTDKHKKYNIVLTDSNQSSNIERTATLPSQNDFALMQFTSGTVTTAKGVMITHKNLMSNASYIQQAMGYTDRSHGVSWLPVYHDMGLIGSVIQVVYSAASVTLFSPMRFIREPLFWLKLITKEKAMVSGAPDFAYKLCIERIKFEQLQQLDLSSWQIANIGAELINPETLALFSDKFKSCGFSEEAFYPSYGMAETTLFISGKKQKQATTILHINEIDLRQHRVTVVNEAHPNKKTLVGSGQAWQDSLIKIVEPSTKQQLSDHLVGEVWVQANNVAQCYWNRSELTQQSFHNHTANTDDGDFFRTGDLGFTHDNELFITGRICDLIAAHGSFFYANDIESSASSAHSATSNLPCIIFQIDSNRQHQLILVQEIDSKSLADNIYREISEAMYQSVLNSHNLELVKIVFIKQYKLPKTSSGKLMRSRCKQSYIDESVSVINIQTNNHRIPDTCPD